MNESPYSERVVAHFEQPRNVGRFAPGPHVAIGVAGDPEAGARFALSATIENGRIREARFEAYGCPHCIAAGSWLTEQLKGADRASLERWSWREAAEALEFPAEKRGRLLILEDAVRALAAGWPPGT
jgi:NifU-like protein